MKKTRVAEFLIILFATTFFAVSSASRISVTPPKHKSVVFVCEKTVEIKETGKIGDMGYAGNDNLWNQGMKMYQAGADYA